MSWFGFGSSTPSSPAAGQSGNSGSGSSGGSQESLTSPVYDTGKNVDDIVKGLLIALDDADVNVHKTIHQSLIRIGNECELLLLSKSLFFLNNTCPKSNKKHRVLVMNILTELLNMKPSHNDFAKIRREPTGNSIGMTCTTPLKLPDDLSRALVTMTTMEMVQDKSINSDWQASACNLLIALSRYCPDVVSGQLLERFPISSTNPPHYFVIKALSDMAFYYPLLFVSNLKEVLSRTLPLLAMIKHDNLRWVFCAALGRWAEAAIYCLDLSSTSSNHQMNPIDRTTISQYHSSMLTAMKHILLEWLNSRETKIRLAAAQSIGYMCHVIETDQLNQLLVKLLPSYIQLIKKEMKEDPLPVTIGIQHIVSVVVRDCATSLNEHLQPIMFNLFQELVITISRRSSYKHGSRNVSEILRTFHYIGKAYTDQVVTFLQLQLEQLNGNSISRISALRSIRYLILNNDDDLVSYRDVIVSGLIKVLKDTTTNGNVLDDVDVHCEFCLLIHEMSQHYGYMSAQGGTDLVHVILRGCSLSDRKVHDDLRVKIPQSLVKDAGCSTLVNVTPIDVLERIALSVMVRNEKEDEEMIRIYKAVEDEEEQQQELNSQTSQENDDTDSMSSTSSDSSQSTMKLSVNSHIMTWYQVRELCDRILLNFTTKLGENMDEVLWPFLLESFVMVQYDQAFPVLCRAIADISKRKKNDDDFIIDFDAQVNIPKPNFLFARLLLKLSIPFGRNQPAINILRALYCLSPNIHPDVVQLWSKKLPVLKKYIDQFVASTADFDQDEWDNQILNMVRDSIDNVQDDPWSVALGEALLDHAEPFYKQNKLLKKSLLSIVGLIIQKSQLKQFIHSAVERCFKLTDHTSDEERLGCARGLGQASLNHCDIVLTQLQNIMKAPEKKTGLFARNTGKEVTSIERATCLLAYGYVCMLTPLNLITSRVEVHVIKNILPLLKPQQGVPIPYELKENGLKSIDLIGKAVHPSRLSEFVLKSRDELVRLVIQLMTPSQQALQQATPTQLLSMNKLRILGLEALATLVKLPPKVEVDVQNDILNAVLALLKIKSVTAKPTTQQGNTTPTTQQSTTHNDELNQNDETIIEDVNTVLYDLLHTDNSQGTLDDILRALETDHINSTNPMERERSCNIYVGLLKDFAKTISTSEKTQNGNSMNTLGRIIGRLIPRITESVVSIRKYGLDGIYLIMRIQSFLKSEELPDYIQRLGPLRSELLEATSMKELFDVTKDLSQILCEGIKDKTHLTHLIDTCIDTLIDCELDGANSSCIVLNGLIRQRGREMEHDAANYVKKMLKLIPQFTTQQREQIVSGLLHAIRGFTRHFPLLVMNTLLQQPIPHTNEVIKSFQIISTDPQLSQQLLDHLLDLINNAQLYEEKRTSEVDVDLIPTHNTVSATQALYEILSVDDFTQTCLKNYAAIVISGLVRVGSCNEMTVNSPAKYAQQVVVNFYKLTQEYRRANVEEEEEEHDEDDTTGTGTERKPTMAIEFPSAVVDGLIQKKMYADSVQSVLEVICKENPEQVRPMFEYVKQFISRTFIGQRVIATCIVSVLLNHIQNDRELVHDCINALLSRSGTDEKVVVKLYALRGLSNLSVHPKDILHQYVTPVIGALLSNLEDLNQQVVLEAMQSVKKIFTIADDQYISPLLMNLCVRLKPSFEKKDAQIREFSIRLFGALSRFCDGVMRDTLVSTIFNNLPILMCHINDPDHNVSMACRWALNQLVPALKSESFVRIFSERDAFKLATDNNQSGMTMVNGNATNTTTNTTTNAFNASIDFDEFSQVFAKTWIQEFPERISDLVMNLVVFYKSEWHTVCASACLIIGHLLANLTQEQKSRVNLRHTCHGLTELLKSPSPLIREKVSKMLGLLYEA